MRCFIAVELPPDVKAALRTLEEQLKQGQYRFVKWVQPDNIHVTLKFLGSTPVEDLERIIDALAKVSEQVQPFAVRLGGIGCFPNLQRPEVLWVGLDGELDKLSALQRQVEEVMEDLGFERESRRFVPHLTVARVKRQASLRDKQAFGQWLSAADFSSNLQTEVDGLSLMESQLTPSGPIYHQLALAEFG
jgi:2'-5' RNA ligase